jgi:putative addiction module component (TIGR02574 family)
MGIQVEEILELSVTEKFHLIGEIWDSIAQKPESVDISDAERAQLDNRLQEYQENPTEGIEWTELKKKLSLNR